MKVVGVIPARYNSKRLPFKLLRNICGKPLIQWTWENAKSAKLIDDLIIACDDEKIRKAAESFGAKVVLTSPDHACGTDRITETVTEIDVETVINIQADEPLIHPAVIDILAQEMTDDPKLMMATVCRRITDQDEINDPNVVKVVRDKAGFALYFSRCPIPYFREPEEPKIYYKHMGIYAYAKDFLYTFKNHPKSYLEKAEKLEQLRALESGVKIKVIETEFESCGVDIEADLYKVEQKIKEMGKV